MNRKILYQLPLLLILLVVYSCKNESDDKETSATNKWIETNMRHWYYWYDKMPSGNKLNFSSTPEDFFKSLLVSADGKNGYHYSSIKKKSAVTRSSSNEPTFGFEFQNWVNTANSYAVNVLYVLPNSPAQKAGLKRGEWIMKINDAYVNTTNIYDLIGSKSIKLHVANSWTSDPSKMRSIEMTPGVVEDNPIFYTNIYQGQSTGMKKIGYMVYNHFTGGPSGDSDTTYDNQMKAEFAKFKAAGIDEFIIDLRYNGGGLITCAQVMAQALAPASAIGKMFCNTVYNDVVKKETPYYLNSNEENLDLPRLFVLTSTRTASASEAVINGLRPYYDVILLGEQTEGKNVGSVTLTEDKYDYELHPIVCKVFNAKGESNYSNGFTPNWTLEGTDRLINGHTEMGDEENDVLLRTAIEMCAGSAILSRTSSVQSLNLTPGYCSLQDKPQFGLREPSNQ